MFIAAAANLIGADRAGAELVGSIEGLKSTTAACLGRLAEMLSCELVRRNSVVVLGRDRDALTASAVGVKRSFEREIGILKTMNHPFGVRIREDCSEGSDKSVSVVTEFIGNGSFVDHRGEGETGLLCRQSNPTRTVPIHAGIALAICHIHSENVINRNLTADNIILDYD
jgi:serine/threonine protein kinase